MYAKHFGVLQLDAAFKRPRLDEALRFDRQVVSKSKSWHNGALNL